MEEFLGEIRRRFGVKPIIPWINFGPPASSHFFTCKTCNQQKPNGVLASGNFECNECIEKRKDVTC